MRKQYFTILLAFSYALIGVAQNQTALTLRDAVIGAYGGLRPQTLDNFSWLPEGSRYAFNQGEGDAQRVVVKDAASTFHHEVTLSNLNRALKEIGLSGQDRFPSLEWNSANSFLMDIENQIVAYDFDTDSISVLMNYAAEATNKEFNEQAMAVAFTIDNNIYVQSKGETPKAITNHDNEAIIAGQAIHRFEFGIRKGIFWSPNGQKIAFYEKDDSAIPEFPIVDYSADPVAVRGIRYPKAGRASQIPRIGVFDIATSKCIYLQTGPASEEYLTNLTWSPDGKSIYVAEINRDQNEMDLVRYDAQSGEREKVLFSEENEKYVEPEHGLLFLPGSSSQFIWFSERDGYNHLYLYESDGKLIRQVTKGQFDIGEVAGFGSKGRSVIFTAYNPGIERNVFSADLRSGKLNRISKASGHHSASMSKDQSYIMVSWSAPEVPSKVDLYTTSGKYVKSILEAKDPLENKVVGSVELVSFPAEDGTKLYGRLVKPSYFNPNEKYPLLVYVYGGPHAQLIDQSWLYGAGLWMLHLAEQGYLVFTVDNRGSAHRGLAFEQATFRQLGLIEIEDQLSGVDYLKNLSYADTDNMAVYGWSFGGFMTTSLMLRTPGIFDVGVAGGAVIDWKSYEVMYTERYMDTPAQNPEGYQRADLKNYVENLQGDLLLIHGTSDDVVILDHTMDFLNACIDKGVQVDYFNYPGFAHNVRGKDRLHLKRKIIDYVVDRIPPNNHRGR